MYLYTVKNCKKTLITQGKNMKLKTFALAAILSAALAPAMAADQARTFAGGSADFIGTASILEGGNDVISFSGLASGTYNFLLNISAQNITGFSAVLNGQTATTITPFSVFSFSYLSGSGTSPFTLTLNGTAGPSALYSGNLSVTAVPEPEQYAMLLAGFGLVGAIARRRKVKSTTA